MREAGQIDVQYVDAKIVARRHRAQSRPLDDAPDFREGDAKPRTRTDAVARIRVAFGSDEVYRHPRSRSARGGPCGAYEKPHQHRAVPDRGMDRHRLSIRA